MTDDLELHHRIALAREMTAAAGVPLRDRYGFASDEDDVAFVVAAVFDNANDGDAARAIGMGNALGECELAMGYDTPTDEEYELKIVAALRPLVADRTAAAERAGR